MLARPIQQLIECFVRLPGVGPKTAERFVMYLLKSGRGEVTRLEQAMQELLAGVRSCTECHSFSDRNPCELCADPRRDHTVVCVVAEPHDIVAIEKSCAFKGVYHVLRGLMQPMDDIGMESLKAEELIDRVKSAPPQSRIAEVIFALDPTIEGETTTVALASELQMLGVKLSRLATGLPSGGSVEFADDITLSEAFSGRRAL